MSVSICAVDTCNTIIRWRILSRILREQPMRRIQKSRSIFENKIVSASATDYCWQCVIYNNRSAWSRKAFLKRMSMNYSHKPILTHSIKLHSIYFEPGIITITSSGYTWSVQQLSPVLQRQCATKVGNFTIAPCN